MQCSYPCNVQLEPSDLSPVSSNGQQTSSFPDLCSLNRRLVAPLVGESISFSFLFFQMICHLTTNSYIFQSS